MFDTIWRCFFAGPKNMLSWREWEEYIGLSCVQNNIFSNSLCILQNNKSNTVTSCVLIPWREFARLLSTSLSLSQSMPLSSPSSSSPSLSLLSSSSHFSVSSFYYISITSTFPYVTQNNMPKDSQDGKLESEDNTLQTGKHTYVLCMTYSSSYIIHHHHHHYHPDHLQCPEQADRQVMSTRGEEFQTELLTRLHLVT